jgi:hypothetical protein
VQELNRYRKELTAVLAQGTAAAHAA